MDLQSEIASRLFNENGKLNNWALRKSWIEKNKLGWLYELIDSSIQEDISLKEKIFTHYLHNGDVQRCKTCGKLTHYHASYRKFAEFCSGSCAAKDEAIRQSKIDKTDFDEIARKGKITKLEKYGDSNYNNPEKNRQTCLERYGVDNGSKTDESRKKLSGKEDLSHWKMIFVGREVYDLVNNREWLLEESKTKPQTQIAEELGVSNTFIHTKFKEFSIPTRFNSVSVPEKEILEWIRSLGFEALGTFRGLGKEIDIYIPEKRLAIEFDGIFWHSIGDEESLNRARSRHIDKTNLCEENKIHLLHIFENEWSTKKEIWKSLIRSKLGISDNKIYARNCIPHEVSANTSQSFLQENHLQGKCGAAKRIGLFHEGELVSLMTVGKNRFRDGVELLRFCNKRNTSVIGAFSKLLSKFEFDDIVSYGNRRWCSSLGNVYQNNGFELLSKTRPNYFYFRNGNYSLHSRMEFQKHKLEKLLENFDPDLTEMQNMFINGYRVIYDCGNLVYQYTRTSTK